MLRSLAVCRHSKACACRSAGLRPVVATPIPLPRAATTLRTNAATDYHMDLYTIMHLARLQRGMRDPLLQPCRSHEFLTATHPTHPTVACCVAHTQNVATTYEWPDEHSSKANMKLVGASAFYATTGKSSDHNRTATGGHGLCAAPPEDALLPHELLQAAEAQGSEFSAHTWLLLLCRCAAFRYYGPAPTMNTQEPKKARRRSSSRKY